MKTPNYRKLAAIARNLAETACSVDEQLRFERNAESYEKLARWQEQSERENSVMVKPEGKSMRIGAWEV